MGPLLYLTLCSMRNRTRVRLRRLKEPRYFIGLIIGIVYFGSLLAGPRVPPPTDSALSAMVPDVRMLIEVVAAAGLFFVCVSGWIPQGPKKAMLIFSQSDVQFLFPAPLTRRQLLRYKLFVPGILISSAFLTFAFRRLSSLDVAALFVGIAAFLTFLHLHFTAFSLYRYRESKGGVRAALQWLPLALAAGGTMILVGTVLLDWTRLSMLHKEDFLGEVVRLGTSGASGIVLWPFRVLVRLPLSGTMIDFVRTLPWVLLILGLHYVWVTRSNTRFEEGSAEFAEKVARMREGAQPFAPKPVRVVSTPFNLALKGRPEMAICWKNLISAGRYLSVRTCIRVLPLLLIPGAIVSRRSSDGAGIGFFFACFAVFVISVLLGPQIARNDLRKDLPRLELLKTWPVDGASLVRGEIMAPAILLTMIAWLAALCGLLFATMAKIPLSQIVAAALLAPGLILVQLLLHNAVAVMWPAFVTTGKSPVSGIEVIGQRLLVMAVLLLVLAVAVVPSALVGGLVGLPLYFLTGKVPVVVPAAVAAAVLILESWIASEGIGRMLDRTSLSALDHQE